MRSRVLQTDYTPLNYFANWAEVDELVRRLDIVQSIRNDEDRLIAVQALIETQW